jgi:general secretion pathway protein L
MSSSTHDLRLFGLDLRELWLDMRKPWQQVHQWPLLAWLTPVFPVRLLQTNGEESIWRGGSRPLASPGTKELATPFVALELPDSLVLRRGMAVPALSDAQTLEAVALDVQTASPFAADDLVWGFSQRPVSQGLVRVETALLSRRQLDGYLKSQSHRWQEGKQPELWVLAADNPPIVLAGFGEAARARRIAARRRTGYGLLLLALLVLAAVAITPTLQLRARAIEAVNAYTDLHNRTAPLARQREALVKTTDRLTVVSELVSGGVDPLTVLDLLTQALPDDTSLLNLQLQGLKVTMAGQTTNAAALMQHLSAQPGVRDVRAPSAATKPLGVTKESFSIEFMLDPKTLPSLTGADTKAVEPVVGTAAPAPASASAPAASAAAVPASAASATPPAAVASSPRPATGANAAPAAAASGATAERPHASTSNGKPAP